MWNIPDGGLSMPSRSTVGQRLTARWGRFLASRHRSVAVARSSLIHPEARIHPRSGRIEIGERCVIAPGAIVQGNVSFNDDCSVQAYSVLVGYGTANQPSGRITLGRGVRIAPHVMMIAANHVFDDPEQPIHSQGLRHGPITVEDDVWVGGRVTITAGVTIGRGTVIGAGAVVTRDIPPYSVALGVPARVAAIRR